MRKRIEDEGRQAWIDGKSETDCPYRDEYCSGDYWESESAKRQIWMGSFLRTWANNYMINKLNRIHSLRCHVNENME